MRKVLDSISTNKNKQIGTRLGNWETTGALHQFSFSSRGISPKSSDSSFVDLGNLDDYPGEKSKNGIYPDAYVFTTEYV